MEDFLSYMGSEADAIPNFRDKIILVAPDNAKAILEHNKSNRNVSRDTVGKYARDMVSGKWNPFRPDNIVTVRENGDLLNGQHRMFAIIESGIPTAVQFRIVPDDFNDFFDEHRTRSFKDQATIDGKDVIYRDNLAIAVARGVMKRNGYRQISNSELEKFLGIFGKEVADCVSFSRNGKKGSPIRKASYLISMFYALVSGVEEDVVSRFCQCANTGFFERGEEAAIVFRNFFLENDRNRTQIEAASKMGNKAIFIGCKCIQNFSLEIPMKRIPLYREDERHPFEDTAVKTVLLRMEMNNG